jgi:hypothetical protein
LLVSVLLVVWSLFALPLLDFVLDFDLRSARDFLLSLLEADEAVLPSFFASLPEAGAVGAVSDLGACANAVNANADATTVTSNFLSIGGLLLSV